MSNWLDKSDALATTLEALPALAGVAVVVDRQQDIASRVERAIGRRGGALVSILWVGAQNPDRKSTRLRMGGRYTISVVCRPVIREGETPADDLVEAVAAAIHGWEDVASPNPVTRRMEVVSIEMAPDPRYLIYEISAEILRV